MLVKWILYSLEVLYRDGDFIFASVSFSIAIVLCSDDKKILKSFVDEGLKNSISSPRTVPLILSYVFLYLLIENATDLFIILFF